MADQAPPFDKWTAAWIEPVEADDVSQLQLPARHLLPDGRAERLSSGRHARRWSAR